MVSIITKLVIVDSGHLRAGDLRRFWSVSTFLIALKFPRLLNIDFYL